MIDMQPQHTDELVAALRRAARELTGQCSIRDLDQTLHQIVATAVDTVPGIDAGSISLARKGEVETCQPTSKAVGELDETQSELGEGPCIDALENPPETGVVIACDFAGQEDSARWPRFAPRAVDAGYRALISTTLSTGAGPRAALNLYSATPNAFDESTRAVAALFGVQASMLLYGTDTVGQLQQAVDSRDLIGRAKGILMERFTVDDDIAFRMLTKSSQDTNLKVTAVARWLCDSIAEKGQATAADDT